MQILDNSRQVPKVKDYMSSAKYCDYLYGYLQAMSRWDGIIGHPRYIYKKSINFSRIAADLGKTRQTISKKFKMMMEGDQKNDLPPLIIDKGDIYQLIYLEGNLAMLVPESTLKILVATLQQNTISTYVYLLNRYIANRYQSYQFTFKELKAAIGIATNSNGNNYIISSILFVLAKIGLLTYDSKVGVNQNGKIVSRQRITWMTNKIDINMIDSIDDNKIDTTLFERIKQGRWAC